MDMNIAVPEYIQKKLRSIAALPPGHRFNLYFPFWNERWDSQNSKKVEALKRITEKFSDEVKSLRTAIIQRQMSLATSDAQRTELFVCKLESPFITGLGNAHPVENGFSFLSPYGLPYLAGSTIKGVLRRAAELMALFPEEYSASKDFSMLDVWWLFGFEGSSCAIWPETKNTDPEWAKALGKQRERLLGRSDLKDFMVVHSGNIDRKYLVSSENFIDSLLAGEKGLIDSLHMRGALTFWDAFPECEKLEIEIMTPHYSAYYQDQKPPHDAGQPNPIPFLAVPAGAPVNICVQCEPNALANVINWQKLCREIFSVASKWQGFGAKTAIGYGNISIDEDRMKKVSEENIRRQKDLIERARLASLTDGMRKLEEFKTLVDLETKIPYKPGQSKLDLKFKQFFADCDTLTSQAEIKSGIDILEEVFNYVKSNDKKKKEVRAELEKLKLRLKPID